MTERNARLISGVLFAVLMFVAGVLLQGSLGFGDPGAELAEAFVDDGDGILAAAQLGMLGMAALMWFVSLLRRLVPDAAGRAMTAGAVWGAAAFAAGMAIYASGALRADEDGSIPAATAAATGDIAGVTTGGAAMVGFGVMILAFGLATSRGRAPVPSWFGVISAVLGVLLFVLPINWLGMIAVPVWALVAVAVTSFLAPKTSTA